MMDFAGLALLMFMASFCVYTQVRHVWQTPLGFLVIMCAWMPAGIALLCLIKYPLVSCVVCLVFGAMVVQRRLS